MDRMRLATQVLVREGGMSDEVRGDERISQPTSRWVSEGAHCRCKKMHNLFRE
jgi:hypothetical protein